MADIPLPPSLALVPCLPLEAQSLRELRLEREYWQAQVEASTSWGASLKAACNFRDACDAWIAKREQEQSDG